MNKIHATITLITIKTRVRNGTEINSQKCECVPN